MRSRIFCTSNSSNRARRSRWIWLGSFAVIAASSLLLWSDARTADTKRPNKGLTTISDNMVELAEYVPAKCSLNSLMEPRTPRWQLPIR